MERAYQGTFMNHHVYLLLTPKEKIENRESLETLGEHYVYAMIPESNPKKIVHFRLNKEQKQGYDEMKENKDPFSINGNQREAKDILDKAAYYVEKALFEDEKTAYELFMELGFTQAIYWDWTEHRVDYYREGNDDKNAIVEFHDNGEYRVWDFSMGNRPIKVTPELHKAIDKQLKEFGVL